MVEGSLNRNRGGWAGLPRQAELIPLILASLQAAGTQLDLASTAGRCASPGRAGRDRARHPPPGEGLAPCRMRASLQVVKSVRSEFQDFTLCYASFSIYLPLLLCSGYHTQAYCCAKSWAFLSKEMYAVW